MREIANSNVNKKTSELGVGKAILRDALVIIIATVAILSFYFFVKVFSILANIK